MGRPPVLRPLLAAAAAALLLGAGGASAGPPDGGLVEPESGPLVVGASAVALPVDNGITLIRPDGTARAITLKPGSEDLPGVAVAGRGFAVAWTTESAVPPPSSAVLTAGMDARGHVGAATRLADSADPLSFSAFEHARVAMGRRGERAAAWEFGAPQLRRLGPAGELGPIQEVNAVPGLEGPFVASGGANGGAWLVLHEQRDLGDLATARRMGFGGRLGRRIVLRQELDESGSLTVESVKADGHGGLFALLSERAGVRVVHLSRSGRRRSARVVRLGSDQQHDAKLALVGGRALVAYSAYPKRGRRGIFTRSFSRSGALGRPRRLRGSGSALALAGGPHGRLLLLLGRRGHVYLQSFGGHSRLLEVSRRRGRSSRGQLGVDGHGRVYATWYQVVGDCDDGAGFKGESLLARVVAGGRLARLRELSACSA